ncbi:MAG TPA: arginase family protein [Alphaproteobacteria bacterium]|nr:arginase family protein [Alphaproteobacteria bacterium]
MVNHPVSREIFDPRLFRPTRSFMAAPNRYDLTGAKAAILGVPFDCGIHPTRIGARLGPSAIREQSALVRPYQPPQADFNPIERLGVVDCGDVNVTPSLVLDAFEKIEDAVSRIVQAGAVPITMGGDGAVTLPQLRALHRKYADLAVLHIDAHTDTYPGEGEALDKYNTATTFTRAAEEGVLDLGHAIHIGARGPTSEQHVFEFTRQFGYELIDGVDLYQRGIAATLVHIHERLASRPVYLCFDMDFFDPSCAPGVCTPAWGGATAREGLQLLQGLAGLNIVAADVNTVSPPHDVGGMTAFLAGTVVLECLTLVARSLNLTNEPTPPARIRR